MPFKKGQSGNPGGRKTRDMHAQLVEILSREHTETAVETLVQIMGDKQVSAAARVAAAVAVLDRGWGKPKQDVNLNGHIDVTSLDDAKLDEAVRAELADFIVSRDPRANQAPH